MFEYNQIIMLNYLYKDDNFLKPYNISLILDKEGQGFIEKPFYLINPLIDDSESIFLVYQWAF